MTNVPSTSRTLIDDLLVQQQELSAVEKFSLSHDVCQVRSRLYRDLLPATPPAPGQQYTFEVSLDRCTGCKACVSACHSLNGLDDDETWREVGLLIDLPSTFDVRRNTKPGFQQHVSTACHHCVDPACLNGCPVLAYDKDPLTGIVHHLDDQCIGCQYCVMMCPYEVPQYSEKRGIVRKCDMCHSRLAAGEAPACAQACPTSAIRITVVEQARVRGKYRQVSSTPAENRCVGGRTFLSAGALKWARALEIFRCVWPIGRRCGQECPRSDSPRNNFLPASPNPAITLPATRFVTQRVFPENLFGGDHSGVRPAESHLPLVLLLGLSQLAIGASVAACFVKPVLPLLFMASAAGSGAMLAGSLHLGQPRKAWRAFLGWRKSWFSREVIAMGLFLLLALVSAGTMLSPATQPLAKLLVPFAALTGLVTVGCSAMIYIATRRDFWNAGRTLGKFFGTTLLLGVASALATFASVGARHGGFVAAVVALAVGTLAKLACEREIFVYLTDEEATAQTPLARTAQLLAGELNGFVRVRIGCAVLGGVLLPVVALLQSKTIPASVATISLVALGLCMVGEFIERYLFFTAVVPEKMPGSLAS